MADRITGRGVHPYSLRNTITNPLASMLPLQRDQAMVYHIGQKNPPAGFMEHHAPTWEAINVSLGALGTTQLRVNLQRDFTLIGISGSSTSNAAGGFRAQLYDVMRQVRFADRGIPFANLCGTNGPVGPVAPFFLREPYRFPDADSQILVVIQNLEAVTNIMQIALYGQALPFNVIARTAAEFPGGIVSSATNAPKRTGSAN